MQWKLPPVEKIYEAFSVLADNRYEITAGGKAIISSSDGGRKYTVTWSQTGPNAFKVNSDDNASKWQGYTGYPIIAILMATGQISFDTGILPIFKGIPWKNLNKSFKNNYTKAVSHVLNGLDPGKSGKIRSEVQHIFNQLETMTLTR